MVSVKQEIRDFIVENFLYGDVNATLSNEDSLLEQGIIDSTGVLEMVTFLEKKYEIEIRDEELVPGNLDSIEKLVSFVNRKTAASVQR
jgi:acyl carrier protein